MGEGNFYCLDDLSFDVLKCYINYGYGDFKLYQTTFFQIHNDEMALLTLNELYEKAVEARKAEGIEETYGFAERRM